MDILITNPAGASAVVPLNDDRCHHALLHVYGCALESQTRAAIEARHRLDMGLTVEARGWKFEPITDVEQVGEVE